MANKEQLALLRNSIKGWNEWRERNPDVTIDLSEADLTGAECVNGFETTLAKD